MKLIKAIIRPEKLSDVLKALYQADVRGLTVTRVMGHGGETEAVETYRLLWDFFPDNIEYGLRLAAAQSAAGRGPATTSRTISRC